jgi:hypothetical protein
MAIGPLVVGVNWRRRSEPPVVLALEFDGEPLREEFRPAWVVSAADRSSLRSVFGVSRIEVRDLGENPGMVTPEA